MRASDCCPPLAGAAAAGAAPARSRASAISTAVAPRLVPEPDPITVHLAFPVSPAPTVLRPDSRAPDR
ncbi:Uncharacterised protein [Mycobacteroides abscessus subsp. abscessus]|nr:Uncharacterised protein [Mycobacteroides abscessus subsp. abscessus]